MKLIRIHYLDASAIVKLFVDEDGSDNLRIYFDSESCFNATSLCFAEALGVLKVKYFYRKETSEEKYFAAADELLAMVADDTISVQDIEINDRSVFNELEMKARDYAIDISDAFQLATVKRDYFSRFENDSKPILITGDKKLAEAAIKEGLRAWYCVSEAPP